MTTNPIERSQINRRRYPRPESCAEMETQRVRQTSVGGARAPGGRYQIFPEGFSFRVEYLDRNYNCRYLEGTWSNLTDAKAAAEADNNQRRAIKERGAA
jgi:hypothetical protein